MRLCEPGDNRDMMIYSLGDAKEQWMGWDLLVSTDQGTLRVVILQQVTTSQELSTELSTVTRQARTVHMRS